MKTNERRNQSQRERTKTELKTTCSKDSPDFSKTFQIEKKVSFVDCRPVILNLTLCKLIVLKILGLSPNAILDPSSKIYWMQLFVVLC